MNIEELLVTLKMLGYRIVNMKQRNDTCIYFEIQELSDYDEKILSDMELIFKQNKDLQYKYDVILDTYCFLIYKNEEDFRWLWSHVVL